MSVDFTMSGMNFLLFLGLALILQSVCILVLQRPHKRWNHFVAKDFIIFGFTLFMLVCGVTLFVIGLVKAVPLMR